MDRQTDGPMDIQALEQTNIMNGKDIQTRKVARQISFITFIWPGNNEHVAQQCSIKVYILYIIA